MMSVDQKVVDYVAEHVLADFRSGATLDPDLSGEVASFTFTDTLRERVEQRDLPWIRRLIESDSIGAQRLGLGIIRPLQHAEDVRSWLMSLWQADLPHDVRHDLLYRLLDYGDLDDSMKEQLLHWVRETREACSGRSIKWYGSADAVLPGLLSRLENPRFGLFKKWIYLIQVSWFADPGQAQEIIAPYAKCDDAFVARVARDLLEETGPTAAGA